MAAHRHTPDADHDVGVVARRLQEPHVIVKGVFGDAEQTHPTAEHVADLLEFVARREDRHQRRAHDVGVNEACRPQQVQTRRRQQVTGAADDSVDVDVFAATTDVLVRARQAPQDEHTIGQRHFVGVFAHHHRGGARGNARAGGDRHDGAGGDRIDAGVTGETSTDHVPRL